MPAENRSTPDPHDALDAALAKLGEPTPAERIAPSAEELAEPAATDEGGDE